MTLLSAILSTVLLAVAALHALWGCRVWWPIADQHRLSRTVVGARGITQMPPPAACFLVTAALMVGLLLPWIVFDHIAAPFGLVGLATLALGGFSAVLVLRGIAGYTRVFRQVFPEEPFRSLDRRFFSPLCLALGAGYAILFLGALS